jgi:hypothetical protein
MWKHAPQDHNLPNTLYTRWKPWSCIGLYAGIMSELAAQENETKIVMIDADPPDSLKPRGSKKGPRTADRVDEGWA